MKKCQDAVPLLGPRLDGALPDDDRAWIDEHLSGCAGCRDRSALISAQAAALREALTARADKADFTGFSDRVMARVATDKSRAPASVWGREMWAAYRPVVSAAGGLALAACVALAVWFTPPRPAAGDGELLADARTQIDEVDFGTHDGAVLDLPKDTTVIWMSEDRPQ